MTTAFILGAKIGDILSGLRIVQSYEGKKNVVVAQKHFDLLAGIPDLAVHVFDGEIDDLHGLIRFAKHKFQRVVNLQTFGKDFPIQHRSPSFQIDQFLRAGQKSGWNDAMLNLPRSENDLELVVSHMPAAHNILVADHSESSPFQHADELWKLISEAARGHTLVRLSQIKLPNFKDFLALYDAADLIVTIETGHLHLSAATKTPVIALMNDGWRGSAHHDRFAFYCRYSEFEARKAELAHAIESALSGKPRLSVEPIATAANPFSYNPSILKHQGKLWTTYRHHPKADEWRTVLAICAEGKTWEIEMPIDLQGMSYEDARLFEFQGKLHISYTVSKYGEQPPVPCVVGYGELDFQGDTCKIKRHMQPVYGRNDFGGTEKNFVFFDHKGTLHAIYQCGPDQIVLQLNGDQVVKEYRTKSPVCTFGTPRGGTQPLPYKGMWLRFFHSQSVSSPDRTKWLYHMGALVMDSSPPFQIMSISKVPILTGNDQYFYGHKFWKKSVVFPGGAIQNDGGWDVACGRNDSECAIVKVAEQDLNL